MNEPYDDSRPYPPEWENNNVDEAGEKLERLLRLAPPHFIDALHADSREKFQENLQAFAALATFVGICGLERVVFNKDAGPAKSHGGFHGAIHLNLSPKMIEGAGLEWEDVKEVWDIHMQQLNDFIDSIRRINIDKGLATEG